MPLNQQAKKGGTMLAEMIGPHDQGEITLSLHNGGKKEYVWNIGDPSRSLLLLPHSLIKFTGKLQQPSADRTTNGSDPVGKEGFKPSLLGKEPQPVEMLAKDK